MDATGDFVMAWRETSPGDGSSYAVFARRFSVDGLPLGEEFKVNSTNANYNGSVAQLGMNGQGEFAITWVGPTADGGSAVYAQCFTAAGKRLGSEIVATSVAAPIQLASPMVVVDQDGGISLMWSRSAAADGDGWGVFGRRFNQCGLAQGDEFQVNTTTAGDQATYYVNAAGIQSNGNFVIVWGGNGPGDGSGLFGQRLAVVNTVPTAEIGSDGQTEEGTVWVRSGAFTDPDADTWTATVDYGDGSGVQPLALNADKSFTLNHAYGQDGDYSVTVTVTDNEGASASDSLAITVENAAPAVTQFAVAPATFGGATTVTASGQFTDPGGLDTHTATIDWGDGSAIEPLTLNPDRTFEVGHAYDRFGVFRVVVSITDDDGAADSADFTVNARVKRTGPEFLVNSSTGNAQTYPAVAMNAAGDSVVVWESRHEGQIAVFGQLYDSQGVPRGGQFRISEYSVDERVRPSVGMDAAGNFVVAWQGWGSDAYGWGINAQRYYANGTPLGGRFVVNSYQAGYQSSASVAMAPSGEFVITWYDEHHVGTFAQRFNASGVPQGGQFWISSRPGSSATYVCVAMDATGDFVMAWRETSPGDGSSYAVFARRFSVDGSPLGEEFKVNSTNANYNGSVAQLGMNGQGEFAITWVGPTADGGSAVYAQCFTAAGKRLGSEIVATSVAAPIQLGSPMVVVDQDGGISLMWSRSGAADGDGWGVFGRRFNQCGLAQGDEFQVNTTTVGDQATYYVNAAGIQSNGNFMIVWGGNGPGDGSGLFGQRLAVVNTVPTAEIGSDGQTEEGTVWVRSGAFTDPDADTWTATVDYGDGSGVQPLALNADKSFTLNHAYGQDGDYSVTVTVTDNEGASASDSLAITVENVAPAVTQFSVAPATFSGATTVTASGQFTDPGGLDPHTATIDWGDGSAIEPLTLNPDRTFQVDHTYDRFGVFRVVVSITDDDGAADSADFTVNARVKRTGPEFLVNSSTGNAQTYPAVAMNAAGDSVVVWESRHEGQIAVFGQLYDSQGVPRGGQFRISEYSVDERVQPSVGMDAAGNFVVAWQGWGNDAYGWGINAQRYYANGTPLGGRFVVNSYQAGYQSSASVGMAPGGEFVITWHDEHYAGTFAQVYSASGAPQGGQFQVTSSSTQYEMPRVAMAVADNLVVTWRDLEGSNWAVYARRFAGNGTPLGEKIKVNSINTGGALPQVAMNGLGEFVITWAGPNTDGGSAVYAQWFTAAGTRKGNELIAASVTSSNQLSNPLVAMDEEGGAIIVWSRSGEADGSGSGVFGRRFNQLGSFQGDEFQVNTTTAGDQYTYYFNSIGMQSNGNFMVVWGGNGPGDGSGLFGQRFAVVNAVPTLEIGTPATADEGTPWSLAASFSDPNADTWTATVDYGDGSGVQPLTLNADKSFTLDHTYSDNGSYTVAVRLVDDWGALAEATLVVTVANVAPSPSIASISTPRVEGTAIAVGGTATDPAGANDTLSYAWSVLKDSVSFASGSGPNWSFTPTDNGSYEIRLTASDEDGGSATVAQTISVANVDPSPSIVSIGTPRVEATSIAVSGTATDAAGANDTLSYAWSVYKDGGTTAFATGTGASWSFTPTDNGSYDIRLTASDEDGGSAMASQTISVVNLDPSPSIVSIGTPQVEGTAIAVTGLATDPAGANDSLSYAWSVLKDSVSFASGSGANWSFTPTDNGSYEIRLTASDDDGGSAMVSQSISVANVPPTPSLSGLASVNEGTAYTLNLTSSDPGTDTISAWEITWGDGNVQTVSGNPASVTHTYADGSNNYTISAQATDEDGTYNAGNTLAVRVDNVAPTPTLSGLASVNEGACTR